MSHELELMTKCAQVIAMGGLGKDFVYCIEEDKFYIYDDNYWRHIFEIEISRMIMEDKELSKLLSHTIGRREQVIKNLKIMVQMRLDNFNRNGYINFDFGEFDPDTLQYFPHNKEHYSTIRIAYPSMENKGCPLWLRTLDEIFEGFDVKINLLQEFFGYCLTRETKQRKALLLLGESNCGKSTILNVLRSMVGTKNCSAVPLRYISHPQYTPMLINKLVNIDSDVSAKASEFEAEFKIITSGEPVSCNQKFVETFEFVPYCKIVMAANVFPHISDHSSAFYNRLLLIPFDRIFDEKEQNKNLYKELEKELFGIFHWACEGLERLNKRGHFEQYDFMKNAVRELENDNNPVNLFFETHVVIEPESEICKKDLYDYYERWAKSHGHYPLSIIRFNKEVYRNHRRYTKPKYQRRSDGKRCWQNLKYLPEPVTIGQPREQIINWEE